MPTNYSPLKVGETLDQYYKRIGITQTNIPGNLSGAPLQSSTITPASIAPPKSNIASSIVSPAPTPIPVVPQPAPQPTFKPQELSPIEKSSQDLINRLTTLYESRVGESAYRTEQESLQGVPELDKTLRDLRTQQQQILNEQTQIQLQAPGPGQGALPTGVIQRQQTEKLRQNAVNALSVSSLVAAAEGNVASARALVDKAVSAKYDPIDEEINAKIKNLQLITQSPEYTLAEKKRADRQEAIQLAEKEKLVEVRTQAKNILEIATQVAATGRADALTLRKIQEAPDQITAAQLAAPFLEEAVDVKSDLTYKELPDGRAVMIDSYGNIVKTVYTPSTPLGGGGEAQITTLNGKPLTDTQSTSLGYAQRLNDANSIITELGNKFTGLSSYISSSSIFPNILKSDDRQRYEQAQRNFVNAVLRKESGAAISPSEFDSAAKQYFPQPGDSQSVISQKTSNRLRAISNLAQSANVPLSTVSGSQQQSNGSYADYLKAIGE